MTAGSRYGSRIHGSSLGCAGIGSTRPIWSSACRQEELVLDALRRSKASLEGASREEFSDYVGGLAPEEFAGVLNNVKGIYHELLFARAENLDGDEVSARLFEDTNHPGADVEFVVDGDVIREVQLKATSSVSEIAEHLSHYPDIEILATSEIADAHPDAGSSGLANATLTGDLERVVGGLQGEGTIVEVAEGLATSALASVAIAAGQIVRGRRNPTDELRTIGGDMAVGGAAAAFLDVLIDGMS